MRERPKSLDAVYLVSACLAGFNCRYDCSGCTNTAVQNLVISGQALPICPEQLAGLPTPRECCELRVDSNGDKRVLDKDGRDYTKEFAKGAALTLATCEKLGLTKAILKANSPSCGCGQIYDGTFSGTLVSGNGITAELLLSHGITVQTEDDM